MAEAANIGAQEFFGVEECYPPQPPARPLLEVVGSGVTAEEVEVSLEDLQPDAFAPAKAQSHRDFFFKDRTDTPETPIRFYEDYQRIKAAREDPRLFDALVADYMGLLRGIARDYFLPGGSNDDLVSEAMFGFAKAVRDYDGIKSSFRSFAQLCVTRQVIAAVITATRFKHTALNTFVSFSHTPAGQPEQEVTLGDALPGPLFLTPDAAVISCEELQSLVFMLGTNLSPLEADSLRAYLEGLNYKQMAEALGTHTKAVDNALQRVKRKIIAHQKSREVLDA